MKLFAIAAFVALPSVNAVYYACCKQADACPDGRNNMEMGDGSFELCCYEGESVIGANVDDFPTCLDDTKTEEGPSIALYNIPEVTTVPTNDCCLALAAAQPGKIRSAATTVCPKKMYTVDGAMHVVVGKAKTDFQVCCDSDARASEISAGEFPMCKGVSIQNTIESTDNVAPPEQGTNPDDGFNSTAETTPLESNDTAALNQNEGSNGANATKMNVAMIALVLVGSMLQSAL